jgi:pyruvate/2-oxoglutarate dehydrogenase complex dihydrolipoamide dehydrogenase (E3) component
MKNRPPDIGSAGGQDTQRRNLIVIGGGAAGLVASYTAAAAGASVTLVERDRMGGDCLNTGCVPSKALIRSARFLADSKRSAQFGIRSARVEFEFSDVMQRVRDVVRRVEPHDSAERYGSLGVECIRGEARVLSPRDVVVDGRRLRTRSIVVATGARPSVPAIPGLEAVPYLTSDTVWDLERLPGRLLVLGAGPVGCELGQCFARLGSEVTIVDSQDALLPREDRDVSDLVRQGLAADGVDFRLGCRALRFGGDGNDRHLLLDRDGGRESCGFDKVLVATGRQADVRGLGLEDLGVALNPDGTVRTDTRMRTSVKDIYACGDVAGPFQLTHAAGRQGWYAAMNALFGNLWGFSIDYRAMPYAVYTEPEVARVGLGRRQAAQRGVRFHQTRYDLAELDRAIADGDNQGFVEVLTVPGTDRILGATLVGPHAAEMVGQFTAAMQGGRGLKRVLGTIQPYPSFAEAPVLLAGQWRRERLSPRLLWWSKNYLRWRRGS